MSPSPIARAATADDLQCALELMEVTPLVMRAMHRAMRAQAGGELSVPQFRCLNYIGRHPGSSVSALAAFMGITMATASTNTDRLARAGLVQTRTAQDDRRRSELRTTPEGARLLAGMRKRARQEMAASLSRLAAQDVQAVRASLEPLRKAFATPDSTPPETTRHALGGLRP